MYQLHCTAAAEPTNPPAIDVDIEVQTAIMDMHHQWSLVHNKNGQNDGAHAGIDNDHVDEHPRSRCHST